MNSATLNANTPIVPWIQDQGEVVLTQRSDNPDEWVGNACPFGGHLTHGKTRLNVNVHGPWRCWGDENKGFGVIDWEMYRQRISFAQARKYVYEKIGKDLPEWQNESKENAEKRERKEKQSQILLMTARFYHKNMIDNAPRALQYYLDRGITRETIDKHLLGSAGSKKNALALYLVQYFDRGDILASRVCRLNKEGVLEDVFTKRLIMPYWVNSLQVSYFGGRAAPRKNKELEQKIKYKKLSTSEEGAKYGNIKISEAINHCVLGEYKIKGSKPILIVEGYFDYLLACQELSDDYIVISAATVQFSGKQLDSLATTIVNSMLQSNPELDLVLHKQLDIVICNDADKEGRQGALRTAKKLLEKVSSRIADKKQEIRQGKSKNPKVGDDDSKVKGNSEDKRLAEEHKQLLPNFRIARLQKLPNSDIFPGLVDKEGNKVSGSVDVADYINQGRLDDLKMWIDLHEAPSIERTEMYGDGKLKCDPMFCHNKTVFNVAMYNYFHRSDGRYYINKDGKLRKNNGRIYELDLREDKTRNDANRLLKKTRTTQKRNEIVSDLLAECILRDDDVINPVDLIPFRNGWLDLAKIDLDTLSSTVKKKPQIIEDALMMPTPLILMLRELQCNFDLKAKCPEFMTFLNEVAPGCVRLLMEMIGYCFHNTSDMQKAFFMLGKPGSGKSTLIQVIEEILGEANHSAQTLHYIEENQFATIKLDGKFANICADISTRPLREIEKFKKIVTSDRLEAEYKGVDAIMVRLTATLIYSMNKVPPIFSNAEGFKDRLRLPVFPNVYRDTEDEEKQGILVKKLLAEKDAIATQCLLMYLFARRRGSFDLPEPSREALKKYGLDIEPQVMFIEGCLTRKEGAFTSRKQIWGHFGEWLRSTGEHKLSPNKLYTLIENHFSKVNEGETEEQSKVNVEQGRGYVLEKQYDGFKGLEFNRIDEVDEWLRETEIQKVLPDVP